MKGGGGAHTREKIVAASARRFVVIASAEKAVAELAPPVPLELVRFGVQRTLLALAPARLRGVEASPDGGLIADYLGPVGDPARARRQAQRHPGRGRARPVRAGAGEPDPDRRRGRRGAPRGRQAGQRLASLSERAELLQRAVRSSNIRPCVRIWLHRPRYPDAFAGIRAAGDPGIEPGVAVLETTVLPIHQSPRDTRFYVLAAVAPA